MADRRTLPLSVPLWLASSLILGLGLHVTYLFFEDFMTPLFKMAPRLNLWNSLSLFPAYFCVFHLKTVYFIIIVIICVFLPECKLQEGRDFSCFVSALRAQCLGQCLAPGRCWIEWVMKAPVCLCETSDVAYHLWLSLMLPPTPESSETDQDITSFELMPRQQHVGGPRIQDAPLFQSSLIWKYAQHFILLLETYFQGKSWEELKVQQILKGKWLVSLMCFSFQEDMYLCQVEKGRLYWLLTEELWWKPQWC